MMRWTKNEIADGYQIGTAEHGVLVKVLKRDGLSSRGDRLIILPDEIRNLAEIVRATPEFIKSAKTILDADRNLRHIFRQETIIIENVLRQADHIKNFLD